MFSVTAYPSNDASYDNRPHNHHNNNKLNDGQSTTNSLFMIDRFFKNISRKIPLAITINDIAFTTFLFDFTFRLLWA